MDEFIITLDVDWAPDFVVDEVADRLADRGVRATWFLTHEGPAVERLKSRHALFELGIHPNFLEGSSQGSDPTEVLGFFRDLVPNAVSVRSHAMVQSSRLMELYASQTALRVDSTLFLPGWPDIHPFEHRVGGRSMVRIPFCWADDYELSSPNGAPGWAGYERMPGLKVFLFHPIHVYLNSTSPETYASLKCSFPSLREVTQKELDRFRAGGYGVGTVFEELVDSISRLGRSSTLRDVYEKWAAEGQNARA